MEKIRNNIIGLLLVAGTGMILYRFGLTKEARSSVKRLIATLRAAYRQIEGVLADASGVTMEEDMLPNRAATISQWEELGY